MSKVRPDSDDVLPIVRLVRDRVATTGMGLRDFAGERGISYGTLRRYHDEKLEPLRQPARPETMRRLADALRVDLARVEAAFVASTVYGKAAAVVTPAAETPDEIVLRLPVPPGTSPQERRRMQRVAEASVRAALDVDDRE